MSRIYHWSGFHTRETAVSEELTAPHLALPNTYVYNLLTISSYIPVIGIIYGGILIHRAITDDSVTLGERVFLIIRGTAQILCLGILFLIWDIGFSIHRHCCSSTNIHARDFAPIHSLK